MIFDAFFRPKQERTPTTGLLSPEERFLRDNDSQDFFKLEDQKIALQEFRADLTEIIYQTGLRLGTVDGAKSKKKSPYAKKDSKMYTTLVGHLEKLSAIDSNPLFSPQTAKKEVEERITVRTTNYHVSHDGFPVAQLTTDAIASDTSTPAVRSLQDVLTNQRTRFLNDSTLAELTDTQILRQLSLESDQSISETSAIQYKKLYDYSIRLQAALVTTEKKIDKKLAQKKDELTAKYPTLHDYFETTTSLEEQEIIFKKTVKRFNEAVAVVEAKKKTRPDQLETIQGRKSEIINQIDSLLTDANQKAQRAREVDEKEREQGVDAWLRLRDYGELVTLDEDAYTELRKAVHDSSPEASILLAREHAIDTAREKRGLEAGSVGTGPLEHDPEVVQFLNSLDGFKNIGYLPTVPFEGDTESIKTQFYDLLKKLAHQDQLLIRTLTDDTELDLFHRIADENLFGPDNENLFTDQYTLMVLFSSMVGEYSALRVDRMLSKIFLIDSIQKRRARDVELSAKGRNLPIEVAVTAFSGLSDMLGIPGSSEHFTELTRRFWWLEVGRHDIIFAEDDIESEENEEPKKKVKRDALGRPIVEDLTHRENLGTGLSGESGKYVCRRDMSEEAKKILHTNDQDRFVSNLAFRQLEMMRDGRRTNPDGTPKDPENMGVTEVPLPTYQDYYVVVTAGNLWKKIKIPQQFFETNDNLTLKHEGKTKTADHKTLLQTFHEYFQEQLSGRDEKSSEWQVIPTDQVAAVYEKVDGQTEKYQDQIKRISTLKDYTAADLRICLVDDEYLDDTQTLQNSVLTCTFSGRTQQAVLLGFKDGLYQRAATGVAHRNIDGQNERREKDTVIASAFEDTVGTAAYQLITIRHLLTQKKRIPDEFTQAYAIIKEKSSKTGIQEIEYIDSLLAKQASKEKKTSNYSGIFEGRLPPAVETEHDSIILEGVIPESMQLRARSSEIFSFYNRKLGLHIDKNMITQFAMMMTMDREDSHFLESDNGILCPALCLFPKRVQEAILAGSTNPDDLFSLLAFGELMKLDRSSIKRGRGVIRALAMLGGAHGSAMAERNVITTLGKVLNDKVTLPLTSSVMLSAVSGTRRSIPSGAIDGQDMFTTALEEVYPHGAWALSDVGEDISFSYRCKVSSPDRKKWKSSEEFEADFLNNLELLLSFLEQGFMETDKSPAILSDLPDLDMMSKLLPNYDDRQKQDWRTIGWREGWEDTE